MDLLVAYLGTHQSLTLTPALVGILFLLYKIDKRIYRLEILQGVRDENGTRVSHNTLTGEAQ